MTLLERPLRIGPAWLRVDLDRGGKVQRLGWHLVRTPTNDLQTACGLAFTHERDRSYVHPPLTNSYVCSDCLVISIT